MNDPLLETTGAKRSWVGDFFEELTKKVSGAGRIKTSGEADICPDLQFDRDTYFECKGVGNSGQAIMYEGRYYKDQRFIEEEKVSVFYWIWRHKFGVIKADTMSELRAGLAATTFAVAVIDRSTLARYLIQRPVRRINSRYMKSSGMLNGYGDEAYGTGWAFPTSDIFKRCPVRRRVAASAYGQPVDFEFCAVDFTFLEFLK